jgi:hypothetical protein
METIMPLTSDQSAKSFSDIQIFTGLAVLISGLKAFTCGLQSYHWQLVIYMSWLSLVTHASLLSFLRHYLINRPWQLRWRFSGMLAVLIIFIVAVSLTPEFTWYFSKAPSHYARCPTTNKDGIPEQSASSLESKLKLLFFVVYGFSIRALKLLPIVDGTPRRISLWLRQKSAQIEFGHEGSPMWDPKKNCNWKTRLRILSVDPLQIALLRVLQIHIDLLTSFLAEVREYSHPVPFPVLTIPCKGSLGNDVLRMGYQEIIQPPNRVWSFR